MSLKLSSKNDDSVQHKQCMSINVEGDSIINAHLYKMSSDFIQLQAQEWKCGLCDCNLLHSSFGMMNNTVLVI